MPTNKAKSDPKKHTKSNDKNNSKNKTLLKSSKSLADTTYEPHGPLGELITLSQKIESQYDLVKFPKIAFDVLENLKFEMSFENFEQAVAQWLLDLPELPKQVNLYNLFGEPSISIFNNGKFSVDLYFWRTNDTLIHSHGFRGAFKVLYGRSLNEEFKVETTDDLGRLNQTVKSEVVSSKVLLSKSEVLRTGESRTILPGMELVHRVLHLDNPTVTLCIRTVDDKELSQWHHLSSGISYLQRNIDELTIKRILYFQFLFESDQNKAKNYLDHMLGLTSVATQLALYEGLFQDEFGLDPETTYFMIEHMRLRFEDLKWFSQYEDHYKKMTQALFEVQASEGSLKLLAHGINSGYSIEDLKLLLKSVTNEDISTLCQKLLDEELIFNEEHYELQQETILHFAKSIEETKTKTSRKIIHEH